MRNGDLGPSGPRLPAPEQDASRHSAPGHPSGDASDMVMLTEVSPFHCLYQDALEFHSQSRLMLSRSESAASRLARASLLLYVSAAEALVHQAAVELGRPEFATFVADPARPIRLEDASRLLPAIVAKGSGLSGEFNTPPWPQFAELISLRISWSYPGPSECRRAYYRSSGLGGDFEPLQPHQIPAGIGISPDDIHYPRTGLPRDPYALRPHHLDATRGIIDSMVEALDRRLDGALTRENRHRREPIRVVHPTTNRMSR